MNLFTKVAEALSSVKADKSLDIKKQRDYLTNDEIAELLRIQPDAVAAFETAYQNQVLKKEDDLDNFFGINAKQASKQKRYIDGNEKAEYEFSPESLSRLQERIVAELLAKTEVYTFDGRVAERKVAAVLPCNAKEVSIADISKFPVDVRPQLSGNLMKVDINEPSYHGLLYFYKQSITEENPAKRKQAYHLFRQGLDILDLDDITYAIIGSNPNSMGFWFPKLVEACRNQDFFRIPATTIAKVPLSLLQLTRNEYRELTQTTIDIVDNWAYQAFQLDGEKEYFIKTGTYSSKYDFRNAHVYQEKEVKELGEYLLFIHYQALQMASPLCRPTIYGVSTTNEWVVREFIRDKEHNPCIYKGLPLHTEYRVFVDCDTNHVIGVTPYWEPETMKRKFSAGNDIHQQHDYIIYKAHEETLMNRYYDNKDAVAKHLEEILPSLTLSGQWAIDVMQNGDEFWIIDMSLAENSAFYDCVPTELRRPTQENWLTGLQKKIPAAVSQA